MRKSEKGFALRRAWRRSVRAVAGGGGTTSDTYGSGSWYSAVDAVVRHRVAELWCCHRARRRTWVAACDPFEVAIAKNVLSTRQQKEHLDQDFKNKQTTTLKGVITIFCRRKVDKESVTL